MARDNADRIRALVADRHWAKGESINAINKSLGLGKGVLHGRCKRLGIKVRPQYAQVSITNSTSGHQLKGTAHWAFGRRKETDAWARRSSKRMRADNPVRMSGVVEQGIRSWAATKRGAPTYHESIALGLLTASGVPFVFQHAVGRYCLDFAFLAYRVALEIDGKGHSSSARRAHDVPRDRWLIKHGWKILRVRQENLARPAHLLAVLKQHVPDLQIPSGLPPRGRQYRVLVRDPDHPAGVKV